MAERSVYWHFLFPVSRRLRWVGHIACMGEMRDSYRILVIEQLENLGIDEKITLEWILGK
jgi:hypothetical protein